MNADSGSQADNSSAVVETPAEPLEISVPLPAWTPIGMGVVFAILYFFFYFILHFNASPDNLSTVVSVESRSRTLYGAAVAILAVALLWNYVLAIAIFYPHLPWRSSRRYAVLRRVVYGALIIGLTIAAGYLGRYFNFAGGAADVLLHGISDIGVEAVTSIMNGCAIWTIILLTIALYYLMNQARENKVTAIEIVARVRYFTLLVYSGGALLGLGVFEVYALYSWAAVSVSDIYQSQAHAYAVTVSLDFGFLYSSLMVIVYLPVALVLERRLNMEFAARDQVKYADMSAWLSAQGLSFLPFSLSGSFAAIAVPVLTGVLTKFLQP